MRVCSASWRYLEIQVRDFIGEQYTVSSPLSSLSTRSEVKRGKQTKSYRLIGFNRFHFIYDSQPRVKTQQCDLFTVAPPAQECRFSFIYILMTFLCKTLHVEHKKLLITRHNSACWHSCWSFKLTSGKIPVRKICTHMIHFLPSKVNAGYSCCSLG